MVIRIPEQIYVRLQRVARPFVDTPATVIERLLDQHERALSMAPIEVETEIGASGYLLQAQGDWLDFHAANSVGGTAFYYRGAGGPMRNVAEGGTIFLARSGERPHRIYLRGNFGGWQTMTPDEAWAQNGTQLGAPDKGSWAELLSRIDSVAESGVIGLIRIEKLALLATPVAIADANVELKRGSVKGRRLTPDEVDRLLKLEN